MSGFIINISQDIPPYRFNEVKIIILMIEVQTNKEVFQEGPEYPGIKSETQTGRL